MCVCLCELCGLKMFGSLCVVLVWMPTGWEEKAAAEARAEAGTGGAAHMCRQRVGASRTLFVVQMEERDAAQTAHEDTQADVQLSCRACEQGCRFSSGTFS